MVKTQNAGLFRSERTWAVTAGEPYNPDTGQRNGGTVRASVLLPDTIRGLPEK
ncbi:hypothetical protein OP853_004806 [Salmonella enterica]|nr:hypothetical protein [Salmonella enterica]ELC8789659.1 hypothetical protein [Salmonella enterica]